jgi:hypothetical protein
MWGVFMETLPLEDISEKNVKMTKGAIGYVGLRFFALAYGEDEPNLDLDGIRNLYKEIVTLQIETLLEVTKTGRRSMIRRSSMLRMTGHRVSDAFLAEEVVRRFSTLSFEEGSTFSLNL